MKTVSLSSLNTRYKILLAFLGAISIAGFLLLEYTITQMQTMAAEINVSGRQRMLSQRIMLLLENINNDIKRDDRDIIFSELELAIETMSASHQALTQGSSTMGTSPPRSPELKALYYGPKAHIHDELTTFLKLATDHLQNAKK